MCICIMCMCAVIFVWESQVGFVKVRWETQMTGSSSTLSEIVPWVFFLLHVPGEAVHMLLRSPCLWYSFVYRNTGIAEMHYNILLFGGLWENELRSSCLQGKHFTHWAICPSLRRCITYEPIVDMVARENLVIYCNL